MQDAFDEGAKHAFDEGAEQFQALQEIIANLRAQTDETDREAEAALVAPQGSAAPENAQWQPQVTLEGQLPGELPPEEQLAFDEQLASFLHQRLMEGPQVGDGSSLPQQMWWPQGGDSSALPQQMGAMGHLSQWEVDAEPPAPEEASIWADRQTWAYHESWAEATWGDDEAALANDETSWDNDETSWHVASKSSPWSQLHEADQSSWSQWHEAGQSQWTWHDEADQSQWTWGDKADQSQWTQWGDKADQSSWAQRGDEYWADGPSSSGCADLPKESGAAAASDEREEVEPPEPKEPPTKPPRMLSPEEFAALEAKRAREFAAPDDKRDAAPKRGRKERGGQRLSWFKGLYEARKRGAEAEYLEANPDPKRQPGYVKGEMWYDKQDSGS